MTRRKTKLVYVGNVPIGGKSKITVQSMLNVSPENVKGNVDQAVKLQEAGCDIIRVAIPNMESLKLIGALKENLKIPVVADIHFDYRLAIESVNAGVDKIRINPGNIGDADRVRKVVKACQNRGIPIRIGVNSGSLEKEFLYKYGHPCAEALKDSVLSKVRLLERYDFREIVLSIKSSDVDTMVKAYELTAKECDYPLHLGVTEAGTKMMGVIKSSIGTGSLLLKGIGDTIRVSLTANPEEEVIAGRNILRALNLLEDNIQIISCPTCGRTKVDLIELVGEAEKELGSINKPLKVAIMGCSVNGPGEAKEADIGIAFGQSSGVIFKNGEKIKKVKKADFLNELKKEIDNM